MMTRLWLCLTSVVVSLGICLGTGLVPGWGWWYSANPALWRQSQALLRGSLALGSDPGQMEFDTAWAQGGVQQIWGLGVPLWRVPFDAAAELFARGKLAVRDEQWGWGKRGQDLSRFRIGVCHDARKGRNTGSHWSKPVAPPLHSTSQCCLTDSAQRQSPRASPVNPAVASSQGRPDFTNS